MLKFFRNIYGAVCRRFPWFENLFLYGIFGLSAAVLDYAIFFVMVNYLKVYPEIASLTGNICGFLFTFFCNTYFNFKTSTHIMFRFVSYLCISLGGMALSTLLIYYAKHMTNVFYLKAVLVLFIIPAIQFVLNKKITYRNFEK